MKFFRSVIPFFIYLLMATSSWAEEVEQEIDNRANQNRKQFCTSYPGNLIVGAGKKSFSAGVEFSFGNNIFYCSESGSTDYWLPNHFLIWTAQAHYFWTRRNSGGIFLQPNLQYIFTKGPRFNLTVGPEIGFWTAGFKFDYGYSVRVGTLYNLLNVELGYLVNADLLFVHFIVNMSLGFPY